MYEDAQSKIDNESIEKEQYKRIEKNYNCDSDIYEDADDCLKIEKAKGNNLQSANHNKNDNNNKWSSSTETAFENTTVKSGCCKGPKKICIIV